MPKRCWWLIYGLAGVSLLLGFSKVGHSTADFKSMVPTASAVVRLDPKSAYPVDANATSPPGYPVAAGPAVAILERFIGLEQAYVWVGLSTPLWLAAAAIVLGRALGIPAWSWKEFGLGATVMVAPGVPHALLSHVGGDIGNFHPQDVAATAIMLLGGAAAIRHRWVLSGLALGAAVLTRQWAILAVLPLAASAPRDRRIGFFGAVAAVFSIGVLPFVLFDRHGTVEAIIARNVMMTDQSLISHLPSVDRIIFQISRGSPVFGAFILSGIMAWRTQRSVPDTAAIFGTVLACISLRTIFDAAFFAYYLVPLSALVVILIFARLLPVLVGGAWLLALGLVTLTSPVHGPFPTLAYAILIFVLSGLAAVCGLLIAFPPLDGAMKAEPNE